jgi:hypothetical protein
VFYTVPADHRNCPIGGFTHGLTLPPERADELPRTLGLMAKLGDLRMDEDALDTIVAANDALADYHRGRRQMLATE